MKNIELRSKLYDMFLTYNYEDSKELLKSVFTTLVIMEKLEEDDIQKVLKKLYVDADICFLEFFNKNRNFICYDYSLIT